MINISIIIWDVGDITEKWRYYINHAEYLSSILSI
jgi:hypothetical protein